MNFKADLPILLGKAGSISEKFHGKTKLKTLPKGNVDLRKTPKEWKKVYFKGYSRFEEIVLPKPRLFLKNSLREALERRISEKKFSIMPVPINKISTLLYYSSGLKDRNSNKAANRFYPSGGARYPLETYFIALNSQLPRGLYHYYLKSHSLEKLLILDNFDSDYYFNQEWIRKSSCIIIITAVFKRTTMKYADRGYRHILTETGHLGQNIYLVSTALDLKCCAIGGYIDNKINKLLDIDGIDESVIYVIAIGTRS